LCAVIVTRRRTLADYEALALRLLRGIRATLQAKRLSHPLFDTDRFRRGIETAYQRKLWWVRHSSN